MNSPTDAQAQFTVDPSPPAWVEPRPEIRDPGASGDPVRILLTDDQIDTATRTSYRRAVQRMNNQQGIQAVSQVEIAFDPQTQSLVIHSIGVIRDGQRREVASSREAFRLIQRETSLERQIYDGSLTAVMLIEDVRIGDIIDVTHSIIDRDAVFPEKYSFILPLTHPVPIDQVYFTLRATSDFQVRSTGSISLNHTEEAGIDLWRYEAAAPKPVELDPLAPPWVLQIDHVQLGNYSSWEEVSSIAGSQWDKVTSSTEETPELSTFLEEIGASGDKRKIADAAIEFVQNEVRYLGLEDGISSFVPESPSRVFARRFGDCKDKSLLLCLMLNHHGIPAHAVLVNDELRQGVGSLLPSPHAFNHVIAMYDIDGQQYFVDATATGQGGKTGERFLPKFSVGLPIDHRGSGLFDLPDPSGASSELLVEEVIKIGKKSEPTKIDVVTTATGIEADSMRHALGSAGEAGAEKELEKLFKDIYPGSSRVGSLRTEDDRTTNTLVLREEFTVPDIIQRAGANKFYGIAAHTISSRLIGSPEEERILPLALPFPNKVRHLIEVHAPSAFSIQPEKDSIHDTAFNFSFSSAMRKKVLHLDYSYQNNTDAVPPNDYKLYMEKLERVAQSSGYAIPAGGSPGWLVGGLIGFIIAAVWILIKVLG